MERKVLFARGAISNLNLGTCKYHMSLEKQTQLESQDQEIDGSSDTCQELLKHKVFRGSRQTAATATDIPVERGGSQPGGGATRDRVPLMRAKSHGTIHTKARSPVVVRRLLLRNGTALQSQQR